MAEVQSLGDGKWKVRVFLGKNAAGQKIRRSQVIVARNRSQATQRAAEWQKELEESGWAHEARNTVTRPRKQHTVAEAVEQWLRACELKRVEGRTISSYRRLGDDIIRYLGARPVDRLTLADVQAFYADLISGKARAKRPPGGPTRIEDDLSTEEGRLAAERRAVKRAQAKRSYERRMGNAPVIEEPSPRFAIRHHHSALVGTLNEAMRQGWTTRNVAKLTRRPTERPKRGNPPTVAEVGLLIKVAKERSPVIERLIVVAIQTGMRRGELAAMRRSRFDVDQWTYTVDTAAWSVGAAGGVHLKAPKTHQSRVIVLSDQVVAAIKAQAEWVSERARFAQVELAADPFLWSPKEDCSVPPDPDWLTREFRAVRNAAGLPGVRLHDLRHAMATVMLDLGVPLPTVSQRLGHANTHTTASIYAHGVAASERDAAAVLGRAFAGELEA